MKGRDLVVRSLLTEEGHGLRESIESVGVDHRLLGGSKRNQEGFGVNGDGVGFSSQTGDGPDGSSSLAVKRNPGSVSEVTRRKRAKRVGVPSELSRSLMHRLILLILQDDDSKSKVSSGDDERDTGDSDQSQFPRVGETDDGSNDDGRDRLKN